MTSVHQTSPGVSGRARRSACEDAYGFLLVSFLIKKYSPPIDLSICSPETYSLRIQSSTTWKFITKTSAGGRRSTCVAILLLRSAHSLLPSISSANTYSQRQTLCGRRSQHYLEYLVSRTQFDIFICRKTRDDIRAMWLRNLRLPPTDIVMAECGLEFENNYLGNMLKTKFLFEARLIHKCLRGMVTTDPRPQAGLTYLTLTEWNDLLMRYSPCRVDHTAEEDIT